MEYKTDAVLDIRGNAIFNASVRVLTVSKELATIYDANGIQVNNPLGTDATGEFSVAVPNGKYFYEISVNGKVYETRGPISFFDPMDNGAASIGYGGRTVSDKLGEVVSVIDKGADPSGLTSSLAAFTAAYEEAQAGSHIRIPYGNYAGVSNVLTGTKFVIWEAEGSPNGGGLWYLPGLVEQGFTTRKISVIGKTVADDDNKHSFVREANHTGGTTGYVCTNVTVSTTAGKNNTNFEWAFLAIMNNDADVGENVAIYGQGNRRGLGPTWAGVFEATDKTNLPNPTSALVGIEVDIFANGTDANINRIGVDAIIGKGSTGTGDAAPEAYAAFRSGKALGSRAGGEWLHSLVIDSAKTAGIRMRQAGQMGIDFSEATFSDTVPNMAIRLKGGQRINLNSADPRTLRYEAATTTLRYATSTATLFEIGDDGSVRASGEIRVVGSKVVGSRDTGWVAMTGTGNKSTAYDTSNVTLAQLAGRVASIQAALTSHGLIGV